MPHSPTTAARTRRKRGPKKALPPAVNTDANDSKTAPRTGIGTALHRRYLTRQEAAGYLGFSVEKFIQLVKAQQIREFDFGPFTKRYLLDDLEAFAQKRCNEPRPAQLLG